MAGLQDNALRIVLVGRTGSGKSETANTILGEKVFESGIAAGSVTKSCQSKLRAWKGRNLFVTDTPGLFDTKETLLTTCEEITKCVLYSCPGPHAIILVIRLGRFTKEEQDTVELIKAIFGERVMKHMIILFTGKDDLGVQDLSMFIAMSMKPLKTIIKACDLRCSAFNNRSTDEAEKETQVQQLVELIEAMVQENGGTHFSDKIYKSTVEKQKRLNEALKKIHADKSAKEKLLDDKCAREEITKEEMEKCKKLLNEKYSDQVEKTKAEGEKDIFSRVFHQIFSVLSRIWHRFWD